MNINNIRIIKQNIIPLLFVPIILSGCGKKSDCTLPNRHVHIYKKTCFAFILSICPNVNSNRLCNLVSLKKILQ